MSINVAIHINEYEIRKFGKNIKNINRKIPKLNIIPKEGYPDNAEKWSLYWLLLVSCCQNTSSIYGTISGRCVRGTDYLFLSSQLYFMKHSDELNCLHLSGITIEDFKEIFRDDLGNCNLDKVDERFCQFIETANYLLKYFGGSMRNLICNAEFRIFGNNGLFNILSRINSFSDSEQKKSRVLAIYLQQANLFDFLDFSLVKIPIDYHVERVMFRLNLLEIKDESLLDKLQSGQEIDPEIDNLIRNKMAIVGDKLREYATLFEINEVLWHLGRGYCFKEGGICLKQYKEGASPISEFEPSYKITCPVGSLCVSFENPIKQMIKEANVKTTYY
ncbi:MULTISPECIES: hypothetical protein [Bacillus cereus group]|uniref:hypothetical protein n=1 Tax=Bacillus cereus group TaxID=86661 RepID=UPI001F5A268C|nr:hypothetical protein [Bacillus pacificus]MED0823860.1 hypothetical protein [Bacillus pacificus]